MQAAASTQAQTGMASAVHFLASLHGTPSPHAEASYKCTGVQAVAAIDTRRLCMDREVNGRGPVDLSRKMPGLVGLKQTARRGCCVLNITNVFRSAFSARVLEVKASCAQAVSMSLVSPRTMATIGDSPRHGSSPNTTFPCHTRRCLASHSSRTHHAHATRPCVRSMLQSLKLFATTCSHHSANQHNACRESFHSA